MFEYQSQRLKLLALVLFSFLITACAKYSANHNTNNCQNTDASLSLARSTEEPEHQKAALVHVELGLHYLAQGQMARAKHKLVHALELAPNAVEPHSALAYFFEKVGEINEAENEHKKALRLGSSKGALSNNYGAFLYRQNRFKEAKQAFKIALKDKHYIHTAEVNENAGLCALKLSEFEQAEKYFNTAICQDKNRTQALIELADIMFKKNHFTEALEYLTRYETLAKPSEKSRYISQELKMLRDKNALGKNASAMNSLSEKSGKSENSEKDGTKI